MKKIFIHNYLSLLLLAIIQPVVAGEITAIPSQQANNLPLGGEGGTQSTQIIKVGTITLSSNSANGFTLTIISNNIAKPDGGSPIAFQVTTVAINETPSAGYFTTEPRQNYTYINSNANASETRDVYIKYTPASLQDPGNYSGSLNISITDN